MSRIFNAYRDSDREALIAIVKMNPTIKIEFIRKTWFDYQPNQKWHLRKRNYYKYRGEMRQLQFRRNELYRVKEDQS